MAVGNQRSRTSGSVKKKRSQPQNQRGMMRRALPMLLTVGVSFLFVAAIAFLPAKTWVNQRDDIAEAQVDLDRLHGQVAERENQLGLLETDDEIERTARQDFDFVYPGEESFRILPAPADGE